MHNLRRFYYQNKTKIWVTIGAVTLVLILIQVINNNIKNSKYNNTVNENIISSNVNTNIDDNNESSVSVMSGQSVATGETVNSQTLTRAKNIIQSFVDACNNRDIEKAYNLLTDECKEELYPDIESFNNKYIYNNFNGQNSKMATIESWIGNTYKVNFKEDIMITGNVNSETLQDYITVVSDGKINIGGFVGREDIDESVTRYNGITMTVLQRDIYMDYEEYKIQVVNNTGNKILLDTLNSTKTIYLTDNNDMKYYSRSHEILRQLLEIKSGFSTEIEIKFTRSYSTSREITSIVFDDLVLDYNKYMNGNMEKLQFKIYL